MRDRVWSVPADAGRILKLNVGPCHMGFEAVQLPAVEAGELRVPAGHASERDHVFRDAWLCLTAHQSSSCACAAAVIGGAEGDDM